MHLLRWILVVVLLGAACFVGYDRALAGAIPDGPNTRVTDAGLNGEDVDKVRMAELNGTLYATWEDGRDGNTASVYFAKSTNGGTSWGPNIRVSNVSFDNWINHPDIAVQPDGTIWIVWHILYAVESERQNDLRLAKSTDGGATFTVTTLANGNDGDSDLWRARIVADASNGGLYIMSQLYDIEGDDEGTNLFVLRYIAASDSWEGVVINDVARAGRLNGSTLDYGAWFSLTARNGVICAAWEDRGRTTEERVPIYGSCSTDGAATFAPNFKISEDDGVRPEIALGPDDELYTIYAIDTESEKNIKLRRSTDRGVTWGSTLPVTNIDSFDIRDGIVAIDDNGQVLVAYVYDLGSSSDLYLATSTDQGQNFAYTVVEDEQGEFPTGSQHFAPALAVGGTGDNTRSYMVWEDDRNSTDELWSARAILDSLPPTAPSNVAATPQERSVRLTWDAATDTNSIAGYRIYRATSAEGPFTELTTRIAQSTAYVDVELDGTTYFYTVAAVDGTGNTGPRSTVVSGAGAAAGAPTYDGLLAYGGGTTLRIRNIVGEPNERTITDAYQPLFALNDERIYYRSSDTISWQPTTGGAPTIFFANEGLGDFDLAENETYYAALLFRQFAAPGVVGSFCNVSEPHYGTPGQNLYVEQYDLATDIALSDDRKWLVYRTLGFCNVVASGVYSPPRLCFVNLTNSEVRCEEGFDYDAPDFAPSGAWLAFSAPFTGQQEIWKAQLQADGTLSNFVQLTRGPANQPSTAPSWSTDGNWIVFQRDIDPGEGEDWRLFVVRSDGVGVRDLGVAGENPAWRGGGPEGPPPPPTGSATLRLPILIRE